MRWSRGCIFGKEGQLREWEEMMTAAGISITTIGYKPTTLYGLDASEGSQRLGKTQVFEENVARGCHFVFCL